jgi:uncharacterized membrane protein
VPLASLRPDDLIRLAQQMATKYPLLFALAGAVSLVAYVSLILVPVCGSYGRVWEKIAAGFLSLYLLAVLVGAGALVGVLIFYQSPEIKNALP